MKIEKKVLVAKAEAYLASSGKRAAEDLAARQAAWDRDRTAWLTAKGDKAKTEAQYVLDCLRKGRVPQRDRLNVLRELPWHSARPTQPTISNPQRDYTARRVIQVLKATPDETISTSALAQLGVRDIGFLL